MAQKKIIKNKGKESRKQTKSLLGEIVKFIPDEPYDESDPNHAEYIKRDNYKSYQNPEGRPTVMTKQVLAKLEWAFQIGASDRLACIFAGIHLSTLYRYCEKHPEFSEQKEDFKHLPSLNALKNIAVALKTGSVGDSWIYLAKKLRKEFGNDKEGPEDERAYTIEEIEAISRGEFRVVEDKKTT